MDGFASDGVIAVGSVAVLVDKLSRLPSVVLGTVELLTITGRRVSGVFETLPATDVLVAPTTVLTTSGFCKAEESETERSTGAEIPVGDNTVVLPGWGAMGTCPLETFTTVLTKLTCFDAREELIDGEIGIKIFPPVCVTGDASGLPPSVKDNTTTDFPSGPSNLIAFGNGSPGLRFKTMDDVVPGCFIAICLGSCVIGLAGLSVVVFNR